MQTIYRPGQWHLLVIPGALVALPPDAQAEIVTALWERLPAQKTLATVLDVLTAHAGGSFTALPPFAAAVAEGDDVRIALRGGVSARVSTADGAQQLDGAAVTTWSERFVGRATRVEITVEESAGHAGLPVQTGIVRAAAVSAEFESADTSPLPGTLGPAPVVEPSDPGVSAAVLTAGAVALAGFGATTATATAAAGLGAAHAAGAGLGAAAASAAGAASGAASAAAAGIRPAPPAAPEGTAASATGSAAVRDESDADDAISAPLVGSVAVPPAPERPASEPSPDGASADANLDATHADDASASDLDESASDADDADRAAPADDANSDAVSPPPARPVDPDAPTEQLDALPVVAELVAPDAPPVDGDGDSPHDAAATDQDRAAVVEGVTLIPTEATIGASDDDFDQLFGDTVHTAPPAPRISAPPAPPLPPAPFPVQGDHDGSTVSADELRALRQQPPSADETPTAVLPVAGAASASSAGRIRVSSGQVVALDRTVIIGRRPRSTRASGANLPHLIAVESPQQDISRSHLEVRPEGDTVVVIDLHTTNGSTLLRPGADPVRLHPGEQTLVLTGDVVDLGDGITIAFEDLP